MRQYCFSMVGGSQRTKFTNKTPTTHQLAHTNLLNQTHNKVGSFRISGLAFWSEKVEVEDQC